MRTIIYFYREECPLHGSDLKECDDDCPSLKEIEYTVTGNIGKYGPAVRFGPAEMCHPAEGGDVEIESIETAGAEVSLDDFNRKEIDKIEQDLIDAFSEDDSWCGC